MELEFDGIYDKKMFMQGLQMLEHRSLMQRILRWLILFILVFALGAAIYDWVQKGASLNELPSLGRPLFVAVMLIYYYLAPYLTRWYKTRRLFADSQTRRMIGKADLDGILIGPVAGNTARFKWERFMRRAIRGDFIALLTLDGAMALFHRQFFKSEAEWSRFVKMVEQMVIQPK